MATQGRHVPLCRCDGGELVGFTLLAMTGTREAEFRIALRSDRTGRGLGTDATLLTLRFGFGAHGLLRIHLIVRKNNTRGIRLYRRLGFRDLGECHREANGALVEFWLMAIDRHEFFRLHAEKGGTCRRHHAGH